MHEKRIIPVILAGGEGTRLWPLSSSTLPKPFLSLHKQGVSLLEETLLRVSDSVQFAPAWVMCHARFAPLAEDILSRQASRPQLLQEQESRNTAPAIALACAHLANEHSGETLVAFLPCDHHFAEQGALAALLAKGGEAAAEGSIVLFGAPIRHAGTGYGYIRKGKKAGDGAFTVQGFIEKPDAASAAAFAASGDYLWNGGIILCRLDTMLSALEERFKGDVPAESIDTALLQHSRNAVVVPMESAWADVGSWEDVWSTSRRCADGNATLGSAELRDTSGSLIVSQTGQRITTLGVQDLVIIATDGHILIADRKQAQDIRCIAPDMHPEEG